MDPKLNLIATVFWLIAVLPAVYPSSGRWVDKLGAILVFVPYLYLVILFHDIIDRAMMPEPWDLVMAFGLTFLLLGQVYRYTGAILPCLVLTFLLYDLHGNLLTGVLAHASFDFDLLLGKLFSETEAGLFGMITGVSMKYLVYFTILGGIIGSLNLGRIIANIASMASGGRADGPGIVTTIASIFMGMFSGSGAADTQFVSTISKPMYEKAGYDRYVASGIAATAGTIAMVTPPVLGSMAFIMVEILSIPYFWICIMALGPMALYAVAILSYNYFYVKKKGLKPIEDGEHYGGKYFRRYCYIFLPILLIVAFIYWGYPVSLAVVCALFLFVILCYLDPTIRPKSPRVLLSGLANGFSSLIPIGTAVVCANLILTLMVMTGLPNKFSELLTMVSGESLLLATYIRRRVQPAFGDGHTAHGHLRGRLVFDRPGHHQGGHGQRHPGGGGPAVHPYVPHVLCHPGRRHPARGPLGLCLGFGFFNRSFKNRDLRGQGGPAQIFTRFFFYPGLPGHGPSPDPHVAHRFGVSGDYGLYYPPRHSADRRDCHGRGQCGIFSADLA